MANNNVQNVRFLRNGTLFTSREQATSALTNFTLTSEMDGSSILARYRVGTGPIKTLVGYVYYKDASNNSVTIFDVDDAGSDVDENIKTAIQALDAEETSSDGKNVQVKVTETDGKIAAVNITTDNTVNSGDVATAIETEIGKLDYSDVAVAGQYVSQVSESDGKIAVTRVALPSLPEVKETGKPIVAVSEDKGQVAASLGNINAEFVDIADSGQKFTATTVEGALAEIATKIDAMDLAVVSGDGEVITAVSETDGKVSASKTAIKDVKLTGYAKNTTATGAIASTDTVNEALSKLENKAAAITIASADKTVKVTTASTGTDISVNIDGTTLIKNASTGVISSGLKIVSIKQGAESTYASQYQLVYGDSNQPIGDIISVSKDQFLKEADYDPKTQKLVLTMWNSTGGTTDIEVDFSEAVIESEAGEGLYVKADHSLNIGVASSSETVTISDGAGGSIEAAVLSVNADNIEVQNIQKAIDYKVSTLDADLSGNTTHVKVGVAEADGKITAVTVDETDIASAQGLADEITARGNADTELSNRLGSGVTTANTASAQLSALSGTSEDASGVTSVWGAKKYAQQYADEKVTAVVDGLDATVSGKTADGKVNVKVTEANGVITAVDVVGTDIASDSALTAEIKARKAVDGQNGQTYAANTSANYISGATSLNDADVKLDAALKAADDAMLTGVVASNGIAVSDKADKSQTISVKVNNDGGIVNDVTGLHLGTIDCGVY